MANTGCNLYNILALKVYHLNCILMLVCSTESYDYHILDIIAFNCNLLWNVIYFADYTIDRDQLLKYPPPVRSFTPLTIFRGKTLHDFFRSLYYYTVLIRHLISRNCTLCVL